MDGKKQSLYFLGIMSFAGLYIAFGFLYALDKRDTSNAIYEVFRGKVLAADKADGDARILLAGGSNAVWGFRSQIIEEETGIPTFNLALLHEAYDPQAMRELVLSAVQPGDTVVYSSASFWNSRNTDPEAAAELLKVAGLDGADASRLDTIIQTLNRYWSPYPQKSTIANSFVTLYRRYILQEASIHSQGLNEKGDLASCNKQGIVGPAGYVPPPDTALFMQRLQDFEQALQKRGANLILIFPAILIRPEDQQAWVHGYTPFLMTIRTHLTVATQNVESNLYTDESLFCDSCFHLGDIEAAQRSRTLGRLLRERNDQLRKLTKN